VATSGDCDDNPLACGSNCFPGNPAADVCDGADQDCDSSLDENPDLLWFADADGDGVGALSSTTSACTQPAGFVATSGDCDDNPLACGSGCFPGNVAADVCDGADQDCDSSVDEDPDPTWFEDADGDSFGSSTSTANACAQPVGFVADNTDCADLAGSDPDCGGTDGANCNPLATDVFDDGIDQDCDGVDLLYELISPYDEGEWSTNTAGSWAFNPDSVVFANSCNRSANYLTVGGI